MPVDFASAAVTDDCATDDAASILAGGTKGGDVERLGLPAADRRGKVGVAAVEEREEAAGVVVIAIGWLTLEARAPNPAELESAAEEIPVGLLTLRENSCTRGA